MKEVTLNNGIVMPAVGYGTWQNRNGEGAVESVKEALKAGYTHIDTAACYHNEESVGEAIRQAIDEGIITRENLFLTTKVWNPDRGYESTLKAFNASITRLGVDYVDLYLIHWPANAKQFDNWEQINLDTWKAMTELYKAGKIRAIGVSNFKPHHLKALMETEVKPAVNQIEYHPGNLQEDIVTFCQDNDILVEAWSPLGTGRVLGDERLQAIAARYNKSVAQLCVRFALQNGVVPLPKSVTPSRIVENLNVFDFEIAEDDMADIRNMAPFGGSGLDADEVDF